MKKFIETKPEVWNEDIGQDEVTPDEPTVKPTPGGEKAAAAAA
jgi:hypothetical protein